jgi:hypothetical protein
VRERSLDHRRGGRLIPRQVRSRRRDKGRGERNNLTFPLPKKPLRCGQQPSRVLNRAYVTHALNRHLNTGRIVQMAVIVRDLDM